MIGRDTITGWIAGWKTRARQLKRMIRTLSFAYGDPRKPWLAKVLAICVVGYALSPLDLIPDPIPVLGYLDDLVLIPIGVMLVVRMLPDGVWADAQTDATAASEERAVNWIAGGIVIAIWLAVAVFGALFFWRWLG